MGTICVPATKNKLTTSTGIVDELVDVVVSITGNVVVLAGWVVAGGLVVVALRSYGILLGSICLTDPPPGSEQPPTRTPITANIPTMLIRERLIKSLQGIQ
jgi:hypothetical protein